MHSAGTVMQSAILGVDSQRVNTMRHSLAAWWALAAVGPGWLPAGEVTAPLHAQAWPAGAHGALIRPDVESFLDKLLAAMTVEEKVGQMIQADIGSIAPADLLTYKLGSIEAGGNSAPGNDVRSTPQSWLAMTEAYYQASVGAGHGGHVPIPILFAIDAVHGHARLKGATIFPHNIALGAAHDPPLIRRIGEATAEEVVTTGIDWSFAPTLAVARDVRWGRTYESYSEDPVLIGSYATAIVSGLQGEIATPAFLGSHHTLASAKHFLGDGGTTDGRDQGENTSAEQELMRVHAAGFRAAVGAGVTTIMASYSSWQGVKMHANHGLLTEVLKGRLGFDGFVVGDWNGQEQVPGCSKLDCAAAYLAGVDMLMGPDGWKELYRNTVREAQDGTIPAVRIDDAVRRILRVKALAGLFERPSPAGRSESGHFEQLGSEAHRALARRAVRESLVLLKNEHAQLPLDPHKRYLVAGDGADNLAKQTGGWTIDWQGDHNRPDDFPGATSIYGGIRAAIERAGGTVTLSANGHYRRRPDAAIVVIGENPYAEFEGDLENLAFSRTDAAALALLRRLHSRNIPVVVVFLSGRPLWVNPELNAADAFVAAWLPGSEGGGVADVLFRAPDGTVPYDFTGRLSFSWPRTAMPVRLDEADRPIDPLFARGFGLTYKEATALPTLSEDPRIPAEFDGRDTLFFAGHVSAPWSIYLDDPAGAVRLTTPNQASPAGAVSVALGEAAVSANWQGLASATLRFSGRPVDVRADGALSIRYRVDRPPSKAVNLTIDCGRGCSAVLDITHRIASDPRARWQRMSLPLACFAVQGGPLAETASPFAMTTEGVLGVSFSEIKFEHGRRGRERCPKDAPRSAQPD